MSRLAVSRNEQFGQAGRPRCGVHGPGTDAHLVGVSRGRLGAVVDEGHAFVVGVREGHPLVSVPQELLLVTRPRGDELRHLARQPLVPAGCTYRSAEPVPQRKEGPGAALTPPSRRMRSAVSSAVRAALSSHQYRNTLRDPREQFAFDGYGDLEARMRRELGDAGSRPLTISLPTKSPSSRAEYGRRSAMSRVTVGFPARRPRHDHTVPRPSADHARDRVSAPRCPATAFPLSLPDTQEHHTW